MNTIEMVEMVCPKCMFCGVQTTLEVSLSGFQLRQNGAAVQVAFPEMPMEIREIVISGTHPECWAAEFGIDWEEV
jgi:hypothetical protein